MLLSKLVRELIKRCVILTYLDVAEIYIKTLTKTKFAIR